MSNEDLELLKEFAMTTGGTVDVQSRQRQGTSIKIKIPLTLAFIPALIVSSDGDRYAIPQVRLLELVRLEDATVTNGIEWIQGAPVYRLRGQLLPLVYLRNELKLGKYEGPAGSVVRYRPSSPTVARSAAASRRSSTVVQVTNPRLVAGVPRSSST